jgi:CHAT domain-containing protein
LKALPQLRYAREEVEDLRAIFPRVTALCGEDATEGNVRHLVDSGEMPKYDVIHVASHALTETAAQRNRHSLVLSGAGMDDARTMTA